jgi:uncharacterized membrane protein HdeD (DUF308 family)
MALYEHRDVVDTPAGRTTSLARTHRFSPGQILSGLVGLLLVVFGVIAVTRTGIDSSLNTPVRDIMGLAHSAWVGLFELLMGLLLLIGSADISVRGVAGGVGVILFIAGIVVAAGTGEILLRIGTERATGWFAAVLGAIAVAASLLPTFLRSDRMVESDRGLG